MNAQAQRNYTATLLKFLEESEVKNPVEMQDILAALHRHETTLHRLAEIACERETTPAEDRKDTATENKVKVLAAKLGFSVEFQGDPRGCMIRLTLPSGRSNSWGGGEWVIDW